MDNIGYKVSSDGTAAVSLTEEWREMSTAPLNVNIQALTAGKVNVRAFLRTAAERERADLLGWAPMPKEPGWMKGRHVSA